MPDTALAVLGSQQTSERLPYPGLARAIEDIMSRQDVVAPLRTVMPLGQGGQLLLMPAGDSDIGMAKIVTVHPDNPSIDRPTIQGEVTVFDARTGKRHGILDGAVVSGRRTAALSLLAAQYLAPEPDATVLIMGAGTQARTHLDAFIEGLGTQRVYICSRSPGPARALAEYARRRGLSATVVERPEQALDEARVVATVTTRAQPVLPEKLPAGTFVAAVGAFRPGMAELPSQLIAESAVVVDTLEGAREEAGGLIQAQQAGALDWRAVPELSDIVAKRRRIVGDSIVFKSVGTSRWDLAAARMAFQQAE